jgi:diguanylate cyclase (GGDEF)-like protein
LGALVADRRGGPASADRVETAVEGAPAAIVAAAEATLSESAASGAAALAASADAGAIPPDLAAIGPSGSRGVDATATPTLGSPTASTPAPEVPAAAVATTAAAVAEAVAIADHQANGDGTRGGGFAHIQVLAESNHTAPRDPAARGLTAVVTAITLGLLAMAALLAAVVVVAQDVPAAIAALAAGLGALGLQVFGRPLARAGHLAAGVLACTSVLLGVTLIAGFAFPDAVAIVVALPIVAVAAALPFSDRRTLLVVMAASWATEVALAVAADLFLRASGVPAGILAVLRVAGLAVGTASVLALLWQFSSRLGDALNRMASGTLALRDAEEQISRVNEELRTRLEELELRGLEMAQLAKLGDLLQSCETSEEAYAVIAQTAGPLFAGDSGVLYELSGNRSVVEQVAAWGENSSSGSVFGPSECWALRRGRVYVVEDSGTDLLCPHVGDASPPGYLCVPLTAQSETLGLLHIEIGFKVPRARRASHLADRQRLAVTLAEHLALALANFRLRATLRERSTRDELTGLFNRRYMEDSLDREIRRAIRDGESLGVLMIDLDHFKRLNDAFGHAAGDFALRLVGQFFQTNVRAEDIACRFGGEEFVIILPKASAEDTRRRAEALRLGIRSIRAEHGGPSFPTLTMSVGVAAYPEHGATGESLLRAADEALYRAKAEGRDRGVVAGTRETKAISVGPADEGMG